MASTAPSNLDKQKMLEFTPRKASLKHAKKIFHGNDLFGKLNTKIATAITNSVGTMWCAYFFAVLALISLPDAIKSDNPITIISWIAQTFLQLVLLPIILVGQNIQAEHSDQMAQVDHENITQVLGSAKQNHENIAEVFNLSMSNHGDIMKTHSDLYERVDFSAEKLARVEEKVDLLLSRLS